MGITGFIRSQNSLFEIVNIFIAVRKDRYGSNHHNVVNRCFSRDNGSGFILKNLFIFSMNI